MLQRRRVRVQVGVTLTLERKETALSRGQRRSHSVSAPRFSVIKLNQTGIQWRQRLNFTVPSCISVQTGIEKWSSQWWEKSFSQYRIINFHVYRQKSEQHSAGRVTMVTDGTGRLAMVQHVLFKFEWTHTKGTESALVSWAFEKFYKERVVTHWLYNKNRIRLFGDQS